MDRIKKKTHPGNITVLMKLAMLDKIYNSLGNDKLLEYMALKMRTVEPGKLLYVVESSTGGRS